VKIYDVLTGFKWIADVIRVNEGKEKYIIGLEESYGYMISDFVRDKDSVSASVLISEMAAEAASEGKRLFDVLIDVYLKYGFYKEGLISINKEGKSGAEEIKRMMSDYRKNPPAEIDHKKVVRIMDYDLLISKDLLTGKTTKIDLPASNVLQFFTEDGSKISVRPSGTEPKIKFYFSVKEHLASKVDYAAVNKKLDEKIESMMKSLGLK
jgi:phosphoglucomutase